MDAWDWQSQHNIENTIPPLPSSSTFFGLGKSFPFFSPAADIARSPVDWDSPAFGIENRRK